MEILLPLDRRLPIRSQIEKNKRNGDTTIYWGEKPWPLYGEGIDEYDRSFSNVLEKKSILSIVEQINSPVVIDLMSPSDFLASLFNKINGKKKQGIAVSLQDLRDDSKKQRDQDMNITQLTGDILKNLTWEKINDHLQGRKADLIVERAGEGFTFGFPDDDLIYPILFRKLWRILKKEGGIMLLQLPNLWNSDLKFMWYYELKDSGIEVEWELDKSLIYHYMKITRSPDSPEKLPF